MKTKFLIFLLPLLAAGCKEKETACAEYAPADAAISWTDYNSVSDVVKYFRCHRKTAEQHLGDTLKIKGWVCFGLPREWGPNYMYGHWTNQAYLTSNPSHYEPMDGDVFYVDLPERLGSYFEQNAEIFFEKECYVTGILDGGEIGIGAPNCCSYDIFVRALYFDTLNKIKNESK